jgi:hypothetical protein
LEDAETDAALTQAKAVADAEETEEIAVADAAKTEGDANAQALHDQAASGAQAAHDAALVQAATDSVFADPPGGLAAPGDGFAQTLIGDYGPGYEAGDLFLIPTLMPYQPVGAAHFDASGAPNFIPDGLWIGDFVYDWTGYGAQMPFGELGSFDPSGMAASNSPDTMIVSPGGVQGLAIPVTAPLKDLIRASGWGGSSSPMLGMFQNTMHFAGAAAAVLMMAQTTGGGDSSEAENDAVRGLLEVQDGRVLAETSQDAPTDDVSTEADGGETPGIAELTTKPGFWWQGDYLVGKARADGQVDLYYVNAGFVWNDPEQYVGTLNPDTREVRRGCGFGKRA